MAAAHHANFIHPKQFASIYSHRLPTWKRNVSLILIVWIRKRNKKKRNTICLIVVVITDLVRQRWWRLNWIRRRRKKNLLRWIGPKYVIKQNHESLGSTLLHFFLCWNLIWVEWNRVHVAVMNSFNMQSPCKANHLSDDDDDDDLNESTNSQAPFLSIFIFGWNRCVAALSSSVFYYSRSPSPISYMDAFTFFLSHSSAAFAKRFRINS